MTTSVRNGSFHAILRARRRSAPPAIRRLSSAVKVPLDAITDRLRESEDADYCAAVIERLKAVIAEFEPPAKTANKTAKSPKRRKAKVAAAEPASEQRVEAESKSSKHVMTFKIPL